MNGFFGVSIGTLISMVVHLGLFGGVYGFFMRKPAAPIVAELDLSMAPLQALPANAGGGHGRPSEAWVTPKKGKAPAPAPVAAVPETKEEVAKQESAIACPEPCAETGTGTGGGGTGEGEGQYIPASDAARKPRWIKNFITSSDYPLIARQEGKDGRVVLTVLIDSDGRVRDARLQQGSYGILNDVALRKIMNAVFTPAYDATNKPVSCKVTLPIRFELR